jgi:hypothetical protein
MRRLSTGDGEQVMTGIHCAPHARMSKGKPAHIRIGLILYTSTHASKPDRPRSSLIMFFLNPALQSSSVRYLLKEGTVPPLGARDHCLTTTTYIEQNKEPEPSMRTKSTHLAEASIIRSQPGLWTPNAQPGRQRRRASGPLWRYAGEVQT